MNKNFRELDDPSEIDTWIFKTGLGIQLAGYEPEENVFLAAHGENESFLLARHTGELMAWLVVEGDKGERKELAEKIRRAMNP